MQPVNFLPRQLLCWSTDEGSPHSNPPWKCDLLFVVCSLGNMGETQDVIIKVPSLQPWLAFLYHVLNKKSIHYQKSILRFAGRMCHGMIIYSTLPCLPLSSPFSPIFQSSQLLAWRWSSFCTKRAQTRFLFSWFQIKIIIFQSWAYSFTHKLPAFVNTKECLGRCILMAYIILKWSVSDKYFEKYSSVSY